LEGDWRREGKKIGGTGASFLRWWEKQEHKGVRERELVLAGFLT
jgi:hypothetical protein